MGYVVVGASAAGINAVQKLRELKPDASITLISKDEFIYSRCILHHYLESIRDIPQLSFVEPDFIDKNRIDWKSGVGVESINTVEKTLTLTDSQTISYEKLLLATGASTFFPPIPGLRETENVVGLRNLEDAQFIKEKAKDSKNIIVIGAGLVGIDAVAGLLHTSVKITMIETQNRMLPMQLDEKAAKTYQEAFQNAGLVQYYETKVESVAANKDGRVESIQLSSGVQLDCDLVIVAAGVRANVDYLKETPIEVDKYGLVFGAFGQTNVPDIYGAGDVSGRMPIWPAAVKEGIIAASNMAGHLIEMTDFFASKSTMNFLGIATMSLGSPYPPDETFTVDEMKDNRGNYKKIIHKDGIIHGAIIQGDLSYTGVLTQIIKEKIPIHKIEKPIFEIDYSDFFTQTGSLQFKYTT